MVMCVRILPDFVSIKEFLMIHHLARAFAVRQQPAYPLEPALAQQSAAEADASGRRPVRPRPLTPWQVKPAPEAPGCNQGADIAPPAPGPRPSVDGRPASPHAVRISTDPTDVRRTVIAGRFGAVCAALDRLVREQEALA